MTEPQEQEPTDAETTRADRMNDSLMAIDAAQKALVAALSGLALYGLTAEIDDLRPIIGQLDELAARVAEKET
jgi:hypothetical protein